MLDSNMYGSHFVKDPIAHLATHSSDNLKITNDFISW